MKVCIIGKGSYIGNHIDNWLSDRGIDVFQLDVLNEDWKAFDYSPFDAVVQVAGIVHRPDCQDAALYRMVNTEMPIGIAKRFKESGLNKKSFVFLSTMAVFGTPKRLSKNIITSETPTSPKGLYGESKKAAEDGLLELQDTEFDIIIVRPPNVYGNGCRGGYIPGFASVAKRIPFIPEAYTNVKQSMLYIDNLCELIYQLIKNERHGIFMPQDERAVSAVEIISSISAGLGKIPRKSKLLGLTVYLLKFLSIVKKAYGGIEYATELSDIPGIDYRVVSFEEGIRLTVN